MSLTVEEFEAKIDRRQSLRESREMLERIASLVRQMWPVTAYCRAHQVDFGVNADALAALLELGGEKRTHSFVAPHVLAGKSIDYVQIEIDGVRFDAQAAAYPTPGLIAGLPIEPIGPTFADLIGDDEDPRTSEDMRADAEHPKDREEREAREDMDRPDEFEPL